MTQLKNEVINMKLKSRKFWMAVAAFLASIGAAITGLATADKRLTMVGFICTTLSSGIYCAAEAYADGNRQDITVFDRSK